ncbi:MAG: PKD domain-containing protein [Nocardioides sp.]
MGTWLRAALSGALLSFAFVAVAASPAPAAVDSALAGTTQDQAAGSCWEIKQLRPTATDGPYWLLTPTMAAPARFYCDMTTDGGGWVLIGKGRDAWINDYEGKGDSAELVSPETSPMSATTVQLSSDQVDELLGGARMDSLTEGVRLRRARDAAGSTWQEARIKYSSRSRWAWTFGAEWPLASYSFNGTTGTGGTSPNFGLDNAYNRVTNTTNANMGYRVGFAYGTQVAGSNSPTSYLYSATNGAGNAIPYTTVWLRPRVTSSDPAFNPIPDAGTAAKLQPKGLRSTALASPWGVTGTAGSTAAEGNVEVQAFTQSGNTMYVGGNFRYVQQDEVGTGRVEQPFLAAFDVGTGEWIPSFRPVLNEQVRALATLPSGEILVGGDFTTANGVSEPALVALDATTGANSATWNVNLENRVTGEALRVRTLEVAGDQVYYGGLVSHIAGGTRTTPVYMRGLGRVSAANGTPGTGWNPNFNGAVAAIDVNADSTRVYAAGSFTTSNGAAAYKAAAVSTAPGAALATPAWSPTWAHPTRNFQQALTLAGGKIWVGGAEHGLFQFDPATFNRTGGNIFKSHGDIQVLANDRGVVYAGCHCDQYDYSNAYTWPTLSSGWNQADAMGWFSAYDAETGARLPKFVPTFNMRLNQGIWALEADSDGTMWAGGDILSVRTNAQQARWSGGFARFPLADTSAPDTPAGFQVDSETADTVTLSWSSVTDASGGVRYEVLRDDRPIASTDLTTITVPKAGDNRFFVRATDGVGNVSPSTEVLKVGPVVVLPTAAFSSTTAYSRVDVDGSASSSANGAITGYLWDFGDNSGATGPIASHTYATAGAYIVKLTVTDETGAKDSISRTVTVGAPANPAPSDVYGKEVHRLTPYGYYRLNETGGTMTDAGPDARNGTYSGNFTTGVQGALRNSNDPARATANSNGNSGGYGVVSSRLAAAPNEFTTAIWFKTTATTGGRLIGYGVSNSGTSSTHDRLLYLRDDGRLVFGVYPNAEQRVTSTDSYRDGTWHFAVASLSPTAGMKLYVDGALVGTNPNTGAQNFLGYWRVGSDTVWSGSSARTFTGSLDEAAIFSRALTDAEIAELWRLGSTVVTPPVTTPPTASFTTSVNNLVAGFDASASSDPDGSIVAYNWDFGDGTTGTGQLVNHTYASPGTYLVTLTVKDNLDALSTTTKDIITTAPPVDSVVVDNGQSWRWRYAAGAAPSGWNTVAFDASAWNQGNAVLGFPAAGVATNINTFATTAERPITSYYTRTFDVPDATKAVKLVLRTVADDGAVIYVNGTEVARSNMPAGTITSSTYASSARRTNVANAAPVVVEVPVGLLVSGTNVVSAETHVNFRGTADVSFDLKATLTAYQ